jgi:hypothetical protein
MVMSTGKRGILLDALKIAVLVVLFSAVQAEIGEIRRDHECQAAGARSREAKTWQELDETRRLIHSLLEDSTRQVTSAKKAVEETAEILADKRRELSRLVDDRAVAIQASLKDRLEADRNLIEDQRSRTEKTAEAVRTLERAIDGDSLEMKRKMVYPVAQLKGDGTVGSGVVIYSEPQADGQVLSFILTAHHVVQEVMGEDAARKVVQQVHLLAEDDSFLPEVFSADVVLTSAERDASLLRIRSRRRFPNVAEFASRETARQVDLFTRAYAVGCPLGNRPLPTVGEVSAKNKVVGEQTFWMLNAPTFFGNSGGGIFLASSRQLIGISSMIYTYGKTSPMVVPHMGLFVPLETLFDWLDGEGFSFVHERKPAPAALHTRLGLGKPPPARENHGKNGKSIADSR